MNFDTIKQYTTLFQPSANIDIKLKDLADNQIKAIDHLAKEQYSKLFGYAIYSNNLNYAKFLVEHNSNNISQEVYSLMLEKLVLFPRKGSEQAINQEKFAISLIKENPHLVSAKAFNSIFEDSASNFYWLSKDIAKLIIENHIDIIDQEVYVKAFIKQLHDVNFAKLLIEKNLEHKLNYLSSEAYNQAFAAALDYSCVASPRFMIQACPTLNQFLIDENLINIDTLDLKQSIINALNKNNIEVIKSLFEQKLITQSSLKEALFEQIEMKKNSDAIMILLKEMKGLISAEMYKEIFGKTITSNDKIAFFLVKNALIDYSYGISAKQALNQKNIFGLEKVDTADQCVIEKIPYNPINALLTTSEVKITKYFRNEGSGHSSIDQETIDMPIVYQDLMQFYHNNPMLSDVLYTTSLDRPQIIFGELNDYDSTEGMYEIGRNKIMLQSFWSPATLMHELTHKLMHQLFKNQANPYPHTKNIVENLDIDYSAYYHSVKHKVLDNILISYMGFKNIESILQVKSNYNSLSSHDKANFINDIIYDPKDSWEYDIKTFYNIKNILNVYNSYSAAEEDKELIVTYSEAMASKHLRN